MNLRHFLLHFVLISFGTAMAQSSQSCYEDLFPKQAENKFWGYVNLFDEWKVEPVFTKIYPFTGDKAVVEKHGRYGVVNCSGKMVIPAEFEEIGPLTFSKKFWAKQAGKWALVDELGKLTAPGSISEIKEVGFNTEVTWIKTGEETFGLYDKRKMQFLAAPRYTIFQILSEKASIIQYKEKFGIISHTDGSYLFEPVITSLKKFNQRVIVFQEKGKWGILNTDGEVKKVAELDSIGFILNNLFYASKDGKAGLIDALGKDILPIDYEEVAPFYDHVSRVKKNGLYGYTTLGGRLTVPVMYEWGDIFQQGLVIVKNSSGYFLIDKNNTKVTPQNYKWLVKTPSRGYYAAHRDGKYLFLDQTGREITPPTFGLVIPTDTNQFVRVQTDSTKTWTYYDVTQKAVAFKADFEDAKEFKGYYAIVKKNGLWGAVDQKGTLVVPTKYQTISYLNNNGTTLFKVEEKGKKGLISSTGAPLLPSEYDLIALATPNLLKVKIDGKYLVLTTNGELTSKSKYDFISNSIETPDSPEWPSIIIKKKKFGLLGQNQAEITEPAYENISYLGDNLYLSVSKGKKGILASNGKVVAGNYLDEILPQSEKYLPCKQNGKWGYLFTTGKMMIPPTFDEVGAFYKNLALVKLNGKWGVSNKQGRLVLKNEFDSIANLPNGKRRLHSATRTIEITDKGIIKQID